MDVRNGKAIIYNGLEVSGSSVLTGTLNVTGGITSSLFGTSSWASNALTASFITPTGTNAFVQGGNSFGTTALLGTNDNQNLQLETNGSVRMTISSSGNVGIGTTTPSTTLNVNGTTLLQGGQTTVRGSGATSATTALRVENSNQSASLVVLDDRQTRITSDGAALFVEGARVSPFDQNIAEFRYAGNGNSLIISQQSGVAGLTTSTNANLNINPNGTGATVFLQGKQVRLNNSNNNGTIALQNTGATGQTRLDFITGSSTIISISGSGRVGIGTTTPASLLHISSTSAYGMIRLSPTALNGESTIGFFSDTLGTDGNDAWIVGHAGWGNTGDFVIGNENNGAGGNVRLLIEKSGNVGIGTTSPTERLHVDGNLLVTGRITAEEFHTEFVSASIIYQSGSTKFGDTLDDIHTFTGSLNLTGSLSVKGPLYDNLGTAGTPDQILFTTSTGLEWRDNIANAAQDLIITGKNVGLTTIPKGTPLYFTGSDTSGNIVGILPADAGNPDRMPAGGVAGEQITAGNEGDVYIYGFISGVNTSAFSSGDDVFVAVGGGYTNIKPTGSAFIQKLGNVEKVDSSNGSGVIQGPSWYNDLPNWEIGRVMVGRSTGQPVTSSLVYLDEANGRLGLGTTSPSAQLHISGSTTTPLRIQNPATTLMQISSSAANSGSIVFFGTTPTTSGLDLEIQSNGAANGGQVRIAGNGTQWDFGSVSAVARNGTGNSEMFSATMTGTSTTLVQNPFRVQFNANQSSAGGGGYTVLRVNATHTTTAGTGSKLLQTWEFGGNAQSVIDISGSLGIGTGSTPNARLFVSGANADTLLRVGSPTNQNILLVSGSGFIGVNRVPGVALDVQGSIRSDSTMFTSVTQTQIISANSTAFLRFLSASVETARYDNNGWGFFNTAPAAKVHISGANADALFRVSSPTQTNILFVSGSGNVGIGTTTPSTTLNVNGTTLLQGGQTIVRGSGATSATTAFRVENSNQTPSLVVLDNGNVGIGTTTPSASLHIEGNLQISTGSLYTYGQNTDIDSGSIRTVMSVSTGSYRAAFFDYVLNKSTNARAGIVFSVWNGTSVEWNDVSTNDIGNTTEVNLSVGLSGANVVLYASSSTNDWSVKALARMI